MLLSYFAFIHVGNDDTVNGLVLGSRTASSIEVKWNSDANHEAYEVVYQLTNYDQCDDTGGAREHFSTVSDTSVIITGLLAYSTYSVFVTPIDGSRCLGMEASVSGKTTEKGKLGLLPHCPQPF